MERAELSRDPGLDGLLDQDGDVYFVDTESRYFVRFHVKRVAVSVNKPHGLDYSLTLHDSKNHRIAGFDNAHPVKPASWLNSFDHIHKNKTVKPYEYRDAATLLEEFWKLVEDTLNARGVKL